MQLKSKVRRRRRHCGGQLVDSGGVTHISYTLSTRSSAVVSTELASAVLEESDSYHILQHPSTYHRALRKKQPCTSELRFVASTDVMTPGEADQLYWGGAGHADCSSCSDGPASGRESSCMTFEMHQCTGSLDGELELADVWLGCGWMGD